MDRITVNLDQAVGKKLRIKAKADERSVSDYVALLIARDLEASGLLPVGPALAKAISEARKLGIDPTAAIRAEILRAQAQQITPR